MFLRAPEVGAADAGDSGGMEDCILHYRRTKDDRAGTVRAAPYFVPSSKQPLTRTPVRPS